MIKKMYFYDLMDAENEAQRITYLGLKVLAVADEKGRFVLIYEDNDFDAQEA